MDELPPKGAIFSNYGILVKLWSGTHQIHCKRIRYFKCTIASSDFMMNEEQYVGYKERIWKLQDRTK